MKVIGIVGGMGAGKSTVIKLMNEIKPMSFIDADKIGHNILLKNGPAYKPVIDHFGKEILDEQGAIDRRHLGRIVFSDVKKLQALNEITHPIIFKCIQDKINFYKKESPNELIILEAALLLESGLVDLTDHVVAIYADDQTRLLRVKERNGWDDQHILERFEKQKAWHEMEAAADFVIDNSISLENTKAQIEALLSKL